MNKTTKFASIIVLLILLASFSFAFVNKATTLQTLNNEGLVSSEDQAEIEPGRLIEYNNKKYWVATLKSAPGTVGGFIAINADTLEVPGEKEKRNLTIIFRIADIARNYDNLVSDQSVLKDEMIVSLQNLTSKVEIQINNLTDIESRASSLGLNSDNQEKIDKMIKTLNQLKSKSQSLEAQISKTLSFTKSFISESLTNNKINELEDNFNDLSPLIDDFSNLRNSYLQSKSALELDIRLSETVSSDAKSAILQSISYFSLTDPTFELDVKRSINYVTQIFENSKLAEYNPYVSIVELRKLRAETFAMFEKEDQVIISKTNSSYSTLSQLVSLLTSNPTIWEDESDIGKLSVEYNKLVNEFQLASSISKYKELQEEIEDLKQDALKIYNNGTKTTEQAQAPLLDQNLLIQLLAGLVVLLVVVFAYNKFFNKKEEDVEIEDDYYQ